MNEHNRKHWTSLNLKALKKDLEEQSIGPSEPLRSVRRMVRRPFLAIHYVQEKYLVAFVVVFN